MHATHNDATKSLMKVQLEIWQKYAVEGGPEFFFIINIQVTLLPILCCCFLLGIIELYILIHNSLN